MDLAVIGTGYVGLVAGTCFAETGHKVVCVDKDANKVELLRNGEVPIYEPRLKELIQHNAEKKRLTFSTDLKTSVQSAEVVFIAVGTPEGEDGSADLSMVLAVARAVGDALTGPAIVVTKSTVPVGTAVRIRKAIAEVTDIPVDVVSNPEFLKEGAAVEDFLRPDRIVIGTDSERAREVMTDLYEPFNRTKSRMVFMDTASAEMTKYVSNAMLATRISFMNEMANLCERVGADVTKVRAGVGSDPRIGSSFLFPGVGFGGSCFPKDIKALLKTGELNDMPLKVLGAVSEVNERQKTVLVDKIVQRFGEDLSNLKFGVWGLAFKPETDDMREAPSIKIVEALLKLGATVAGTDPEAYETAKRVFGDRIAIEKDPYVAIQEADALVVVTEWNEFRRPDFRRIKSTLRTPTIFDGRNVYNPRTMREMGFDYFSIGRP
ncbi:MAG: UDP-glucose/GDP-mannose dehydrogenase family protein [Deltaproteobacteria bacterium]|nr:UDP-glucose/GDP-mannose dehydrogenase family protein [Deltaproteobacteria bacterium]